MIDPIKQKLILDRIGGSARLATEVVGLEGSPERKELANIARRMIDQKMIRKIKINGVWYYCPRYWKIPVKVMVSYLLENCVPTNECMLWSGHTTKGRGPVFTHPRTQERLSARRYIWQVKYRETLEVRDTIRMVCGREDCLEVAHMEHVIRGSWSKGIKHTVMRRINAREYRRRRSPITMEIAREVRLRAFHEMDGIDDLSKQEQGIIRQATYIYLGKQYGVGADSIREIVNGKNWKEDGGMFDQLMR